MSSCIGSDFHLIITHCYNRSCSGNICHIPFYHRRLETAISALNIRHSPSHLFLRYFQLKFIDRLQQNTIGRFQSLSDSTIGCLSEIPPLCMLRMRPSCYECDPHIRNLRTGKNTFMPAFFQMSQYQSLPVTIQFIFAAIRCKFQTTSTL